MSKQRALIAGAGVGGLTAAYWLKRAGWRVQVIERASDLRAGGYIVGLSGPGLAIAERMGLKQRLAQAAHRIEENVFHDSRGSEIARLRYDEFISDVDFSALKRTDLVAAIHEALGEGPGEPVEILYGRTIENVEERDRDVLATLSSGESCAADLVIVAEGVRSSLRRRMFEPDESFVKPLGYRFATFDIADYLKLGADFLSYAAPRLMTEYYTYSNDRVAALHVWRTAEIGAVPAQARADLLEQTFAKSHPNVLRMIRQAREEATPIILDDVALVEAPVWSKGRVVLLGDSAYALSLVSGQGAGMAMAGAAILCEELAARPIAEALRAYERRLRPSIERLQDRSRRMAKLLVPESNLAFHMRNLALRLTPKRLLGKFIVGGIKAEAHLSASKLAG